MSNEIKPCPFCGGEGKCKVTDKSGSGDGYYFGYPAFTVVCNNCWAKGSEHKYKHFSECYEETVEDYRNNPALRARHEDGYAIIRENAKKEAIWHWNTRFI